MVLFKSYYVVWKQEIYTDRRKVRKGLNRTMQYGNLIISGFFDMISCSLNRTMQYGNRYDENMYLRPLPV